jgi:hypothetical protein
VPISPATQSEVEATIRTAPVVELMQAEMLVETGAAMTAALAKSEAARTPTFLSKDIETSGLGCCTAMGEVGIAPVKVDGANFSPARWPESAGWPPAQWIGDWSPAVRGVEPSPKFG